MDEREEEMYLQNLEEYILDEDKIVTYKWLSKSLNLHVNVAKQLLHTFFLRNNKQNLISATYLLTGKLRSTGKNQITVVGQDKYEEVRALFESLFSEHVYSVQKSQKIPIPSILFTVNSQPVEEKGDCTSSLGAIKCKGSIQRAAEELSLLRISIPPAPTTSGTSKLKQVTSVTKESVKVSPTKPKADEKNGKEKKNTKAKGGLAAMFAGQTAKGASKKESEPKGPTEVKTSPTKSKDDDKSGKGKKDAKVKGGLAAMFAAQTVKASSKKNLDDEEASTTGTNTTNELTEATTSLAKAKKQTPKRSSANKKKVDGKKRKRIVQQDLESSDEDMFSEEDKASSREPSPEPVLRAKPLESDNEEDVIQPTPPANGTGSGRCRRRRKVMKDKTFMDEDGYVVTQKVTEYESYSESDSEESDVKKVKELDPVAVNSKKSTPPLAKSKAEKNKVSSKKASPAKHKSPAKSKQQSLTSFFKKKE